MDRIDLAQQIIGLRVVCLLGPVILAYLLLCFRTITYRQLSGIYLSILWCFLMLLFLNPVILHWGGWEYKVSAFTFMRIPMDLLIGWAVLWGAVPHLIKLPGGVISWSVLLFLLDLAVMPLLDPLVRLESGWRYWDVLCLLVVFVPSWYLARGTAMRKILYVRSFMQMIMFILIFNGIIPYLLEHRKISLLIDTLILGDSSASFNLHMALWRSSETPWVELMVLGMLLGVIIIPGLSALQEFAIRGWGTPFPLDPPVKLVTTGPYAYIGNPMLIAQFLIYLWMWFALHSVAFFLAAMMALLFALGYARWEEVQGINQRFGKRVKVYKSEVYEYIPSWKPWRNKPATIYLDLYGCVACAKLGRVLLRLKPTALIIKDARFCPSEDLTRMAYKDADGFDAWGIHALGRALEHINLMWAFVGWTIRLPGVSHIGQLIIDALFPPHRVCRVPDVE